MRTVKDPETRRQEIIKGAIHVFAERGYERTSISDIAKALGISQGLCYRYFKSKEEIYDVALDEYARLIVENNLKKQGEYKNLKQWIMDITDGKGKLTDGEKSNEDLYKLFHSEESRRMHNELMIKTCNMLIPHVKKILERAQSNGEIQVQNLEAMATFGVYGEIGLLLNPNISDEQAVEQIRKNWFKMLGIE